jgi:hypothetical protein
MSMECRFFQVKNIETLIGKPKAAAQMVDQKTEEGDFLNLGQVWHLIHFLISGASDATKDPVGSAIMGGISFDYDPNARDIRYHAPSEVHKVSNALAAISDRDLVDRYDRSAVKEARLYAYDGTEKEVPPQTLSGFRSLAKYYLGATKLNNAMIIHIG